VGEGGGSLFSVGWLESRERPFFIFRERGSLFERQQRKGKDASRGLKVSFCPKRENFKPAGGSLSLQASYLGGEVGSASKPVAARADPALSPEEKGWNYSR